MGAATTTYPYQSTTATGETITASTSELVETIVYPSCQRGDFQDNHAHDFCDWTDPSSQRGYIYCRRCGLVQRIQEL